MTLDQAADSSSRTSGVWPVAMIPDISSRSDTWVMTWGTSKTAPFCSDPWKNLRTWSPFESGFLARRIDDTLMFTWKGRVHLCATRTRNDLRSSREPEGLVLRLYTDRSPRVVSQKWDLMEPHLVRKSVATSSPCSSRSSLISSGGQIWASMGTVWPATNQGRPATCWSSGICVMRSLIMKYESNYLKPIWWFWLW